MYEKKFLQPYTILYATPRATRRRDGAKHRQPMEVRPLVGATEGDLTSGGRPARVHDRRIDARLIKSELKEAALHCRVRARRLRGGSAKRDERDESASVGEGDLAGRRARGELCEALDGSAQCVGRRVFA